jgi:hypothetical protein
MKHKTYIFHSDPGHGWMAVKRKELIEMGILHTITAYSYQKGKTVYLEEDCDASTFFETYVKLYGVRPLVKSTHYENRAPCYYYNRFAADEAELATSKNNAITLDSKKESVTVTHIEDNAPQQEQTP